MHLRRADPVLAAVIAKVGPYQVEYRPPTFYSLARSIVFQQLNGRAAASIFARLETACGEVTPEAVLRMRMPQMRAVGLSERKAEYLRHLAKLTRDGVIQFEALPSLPDTEIITHLTQVKGVGEWTVHMFLMFAMGRPDVLPVGDYGVRQAMKKLYNLEGLPKPAEMQRIAEVWKPWTSVACWYLWRSLDGPIEI